MFVMIRRILSKEESTSNELGKDNICKIMQNNQNDVS